jgi:hypothetical protein
MSTYHLSTLIQTAAIKMGRLAMYRVSPVATSGDTVTITDTTLSLTADELIHGLAIVTYDAGGLGAAPEGEFSSITDNTTNAITVSPAYSAAIGAGDEIMVIRPAFPLVEWRRGVNTILKSLGEIPLWDTSITLVASQTEYTLPSTILEPKEIWVNTNTTSLNKEWVKLSGWTVQNAPPGTVKTVRIPEYCVVAGYSLGIVYNGDHPEVHDWDDHIDIPIELAAGKLAWHMINRGGITDKNRTQADKILAELNDATARFKIPNKRGASTNFLTWGNS